MQTIRQYYMRLRETSRFYEKYPNYHLNDGKVHILYVCPTLEHKSYYGIILPTLELNKTATHSAIISSIKLPKNNDGLDQCINNIDIRLLKWAHYIIFPTLLTTLKYAIAILHELYPRLKIGMYLDDNYHKIPCWHPQQKMIETTSLALLLENLSLLDLVLCQNKLLANQYNAALRFYYMPPPPPIQLIPTLTSKVSFENLDILPLTTQRPLTIGIIFPSKTFLKNLPTLLKKLRKFDLQPKIIIYDTIPYRLSNMTIEGIAYHRFEGLFDYFNELQQSQLTMALFPTSAYTEYQSISTYLDMACLGVPAILCETHPAAQFVKKEACGLIVKHHKDWHLAISKLTSIALQKKLKKRAATMVWKHHSFTTETIQHLTSVFK